MSEETNTRRSARATKGQHKTLDLLDQPVEVPKKRSGGKKGTAKAKAASQELSAAEEDEHSDDIIRCICGVKEQDDESDEMWIACNKCDVWQHNVCVGAPLDPKIADAMDYWCEECKPENHKEYYEAKARGEDIWKTRRTQYEAEQAAAKAKRSKKGKGRKSAGADIRAATPQSIKASTPAPLGESNKKNVTSKRKTRDDSHDGQAGMNKAPKLSSHENQSPTPQTNADNMADLTAEVNKLDDNRKKIVSMLNKAFVVALGKAQEFAGQHVQQMAQRFALDLEQAVHNASISHNAYNNQVRALFNNLKTNQELTKRLLNDFSYIETLAHMSVADMATKERQREDEEMRARAEKQAIMVTEESTGPRFRKTHKGEELVEFDQSPNGSPDFNHSDRRRSMADPNHGMGARSREGSPGQYQDRAQSFDNGPSGDKIRQNALGQGQLPSIDTKRRPSMAKESFDVNSVYAKVQTPVSANHRTSNTASNAFPTSTPQPQQQIQDPDVDRLLEDDDGDDYDPPDFAEGDPGVVWRGTMTMTSIADFPAIARHIAGADLKNSASSVSDLLEDRLSVAGRIDPGKAEEYLCSLRFSKLTDVCVVSLSPTGGHKAEKDFLNLYNHFEGKGKYGVLNTSMKPAERGNIRDTYLIPVAPGRPDRPEFLLNFEINNLPADRTQPMLLIAIVVRNAEGSPMRLDGSADVKMGAQNRSLSIGQQPGPSMSPVVHQGSGFAPGFPQQQGQGGYGAYGQQQSQQQQTRPQVGQDVEYDPSFPAQGMPPQTSHHSQQLPPLSSLTGAPSGGPNQPQQQLDAHAAAVAVAKQILGEFAHCEVANFLMTQAHKMVEKEWWIIREVFEASEEARRDVRIFSEELQVRGPHTQRTATDLGRALTTEDQAAQQANGQGSQNGAQGEMKNEVHAVHNGQANAQPRPPNEIPAVGGHAYQNVVMGGITPPQGQQNA